MKVDHFQVVLSLKGWQYKLSRFTFQSVLGKTLNQGVSQQSKNPAYSK